MRVHLRKETLAVLAASEIAGPSMRINAVCSRFETLVRNLLPALTRKEWLAILDANNGGSDIWQEANGHSSATLIWANVSDSEGLGDKWGIDQDSLVKRLSAMTDSQLVAIDEAISRFWNHYELEESDAFRIAWIDPVPE